MANVPMDKMREMEAEMDRFEQEISGVHMGGHYDLSRPIIGSNTYNQVAEQLQMRQHMPGMGPPLHFIPHQLQRQAAPQIIQNGAQIITAPPNQQQVQHSVNSQTATAGSANNEGEFVQGNQSGNSSHVISAAPVLERKPKPIVITGAPAIYSAPPSKTTKPKIEEIPKKEIFIPPPITIVNNPSSEVKISAPSSTTLSSISLSSFSSLSTSTPAPSVGISINKPVGPSITPVIPMMMDDPNSKKKEKKKKIIRHAGGQSWEDPSLLEWETDDFRIFCGDLGNDVTDEVLTRAFSKFPSFIKAKVIRDKRNNKTKGYGFVSFKDPQDFIRAMREMNGRYVGSRPIKLRKSTWKDRNAEIVKKKIKEKIRLGLR